MSLRKGCATERDCQMMPWCRQNGRCMKAVAAASWDIKNMQRRVNRARENAGGECVTCPSSRHVHIMADALASKHGRYPMFEDEPQHCAAALYSVIESLWKARAEIARLKSRNVKFSHSDNK